MTQSELARLVNESSQMHPLPKTQAQIEIDRQKPWSVLEEERDHGTWDGRWSLPSRSQWAAINDVGAMLPTGTSHDREVLLGLSLQIRPMELELLQIRFQSRLPRVLLSLDFAIVQT